MTQRGARAKPPWISLPTPATTPACWRATCPAAMLFVRNPTGISHNPAESASEEDCLAACAVLARVLVRGR